MKFFRGMQFLLASMAFALAGSTLTPTLEIVGFICGLCFGFMLAGVLELTTRLVQLKMVGLTNKGIQIPEDK